MRIGKNASPRRKRGGDAKHSEETARLRSRVCELNALALKAADRIGSPQAGPVQWLVWAHWIEQAGWEASKLLAHAGADDGAAGEGETVLVDLNHQAWRTVIRVLADETGIHPSKFVDLALYLATERLTAPPSLESDYQELFSATKDRRTPVELAIVAALKADPKCRAIAAPAIHALKNRAERVRDLERILDGTDGRDSALAQVAAEAGASKSLWGIIDWALLARDAGSDERDLAKLQNRDAIARANVDPQALVCGAIVDAFGGAVQILPDESFRVAARRAVACGKATERERAESIAGLLRSRSDAAIVARDFLSAWDGIPLRLPQSMGEPTITMLRNALDTPLSTTTFRRWRALAGIRVRERGGQARKRGYSRREVGLLIAVADRVGSPAGEEAARKWARWASA